MDLENLLSDLVRFQKNNYNVTLNDFLDFQLTQIYKDTLLDFIDKKGNKIGNRIEFLDDRAKNGNKLLEDYLKVNYYFDHCFLLNNNRKNCLDNCCQQLANLGIFNWSKFKTINPQSPVILKEWKEYQNSGKKDISSPESWAFLKSFYSLIQKAKQNGYRRILVLQDDILFHHNFVGRFLKIVKDKIVPSDWKLLYLGAKQRKWNLFNDMDTEKIEIDFYCPFGLAEGHFAIGIDSSIYDELLAEIIKFDHPVDLGPLSVIQKRYAQQCFVIKPNLVVLKSEEEWDSYKWDYRDYPIDSID